MKKYSVLMLLAVLLACAMNARADEPFRKHRYDSWKVLGLPEGAIVFAGNSITDMHAWSEAFGNDARVVNRGNSGGYSFEVLDNVESWVRFQPAKVFIKIGTNDLGTDYNEASIAKNIRQTVDIIRRESPSTEIYLQSIIPAYDQKYKTLATIQATNVLIKQIADETENTTYVDLYSKLTAVPSGQPYSYDGLHLTAYGYKIWSEAIKDLVGIQPVYPASTQQAQTSAGLGGSHGMRATYFSMLPITPADVLFFGDEMVKNGEWNELLHNANVKNRGTGWGYEGTGGNVIPTISADVEATFAQTEGVSKTSPRQILLYTGTNTVNSGQLDLAKTDYQALVKKLQEKAPGCPIGVVSLLPTQLTNCNGYIKTFNAWLKDLAAQTDGVEYIDIHSAVANSEGAINPDYFVFNNAYLTGLGYVQVARELAKHIEGCTVISDDEAQLRVATTNARADLNKAICETEGIEVGNSIGQYNEASVAAIAPKVEQAKSLLAGNTASLTDLQSAASEISSALTSLKTQLNAATAANVSGKQFTLSTPNRSGRFAYASGSGVSCSATNEGFNTYRWTFVPRTDGTFDIRNVATQTYVNSATAHNTQLSLSSTSPAKGWVLEYSDAMGLYIIRSDAPAEFNMSNSTNMIVFNWHNTANATNRSDTGCQWLIEDVTGIEPTPDPSTDTYVTEFGAGIDWYTMQIAAAGLYISNNGSASQIALNRAKTEYTDADLWMRVGNDTEGYTLYNKEAGPGKVLGAPIAMAGTTGGSSYPILVDKDNVPAGYCTKWMFTPSTNLGDVEAWYMYEKDHPDNKLNNRGNILAFWTGGADAGSSIQWTWAQRTVAVNMDNGTFTSKNGNGTWAKTWQSTCTEPTLILDAGYNNMSTANSNATRIQAFRGTYDPQTYTMHCNESSYVVTDYAFDFVMSASAPISVTDAKGQAFTSSATKQHIECTGLQDGEASFTLSGSNNGIDITNFLVTIRRQTEPELGVRVFDNDASSVPYRIPAVAKNKQGDLIFVTDYRYSKADIGMATNGKLDLRVRTLSADSVWSDVSTLAACITSGKFTAFGDPCIVADRESNRVMVTSCCGNVSFPNGTHDNHQGWARFYSEDGGKTWGQHTDISQQVFDQLDKRSDGPICCFFIGSGKISQSQRVKVGDYYRIYCAALVKTGDGTNCNYVFYSDDFGLNWKLLGQPDDCPIPSGGDEPKADELPDGSILISSRVTGGRYYNVYHFTDTEKGEGQWGTMTFSGNGNKGVTAEGNSCNGEIIILPVQRVEDGRKTYLLLQSVPFGSGRANVGIYYKELSDLSKYRTSAEVAPNWDGKYQVTRKDAAYSTMCLDKDNKLAFFYEESGYNGGYNMIYRKISVEELTGGKYTYSTLTDDERKAFLTGGMEAYLDQLNITDRKVVGMPSKEDVAQAAEGYKASGSTQDYEVFNDALANGGVKLDKTGNVQYYLENMGRSTASATYVMTYAGSTFKGATSTEAPSNETSWMQFIPVEGQEDVYYLYNAKAGKYYGKLGNNETQAAPVSNKADAGTFRVELKGMGLCAFNNLNHTGSNTYIHLAGDNTRLVPWSATDASLWRLVVAKDVEDGLQRVSLDDVKRCEEMMYDLTGRRVTTTPRRGVSIVGGKKVVK